MNLNATGDIVFPIDVSYDFQRDQWIDNQNDKMPVKLSWTVLQGEVYPRMNDILLVAIVSSRSG